MQVTKRWMSKKMIKRCAGLTLLFESIKTLWIMSPHKIAPMKILESNECLNRCTLGAITSLFSPFMCTSFLLPLIFFIAKASFSFVLFQLIAYPIAMRVNLTEAKIRSLGFTRPQKIQLIPFGFRETFMIFSSDFSSQSPQNIR